MEFLLFFWFKLGRHGLNLMNIIKQIALNNKQ